MAWVVLAHGRDATRSDRTVADLRTVGVAYPYMADLASLGQTVALARQTTGDHTSVDLVVNNAGVGFGVSGESRELSGPIWKFFGGRQAVIRDR